MPFTLSTTNFKSAKYLFAKIKRDLSSFDGVNQIDEADFPLYVAEVLKTLGVGAYKESNAILTVHNGTADLPSDFMFLYAAYYAKKEQDTVDHLIYQRGSVLINDVTCEVVKNVDFEMLGVTNRCELDCGDFDKVFEKVTTREYVNDTLARTRTWDKNHLLRLSPNVKSICSDDSVHHSHPHDRCEDEITISDNKAYVNFKNADIFLQYYAFPFDKDGTVMIPDVIQIEKAIEFYIKYQLFLIYWLNGSVADIQQKWGKLEQMYLEALADAKNYLRTPSFQTLVHSIRQQRKINKVSYFSQQDSKR